MMVAENIFDVLKIEKENEFELPKWVNDDVFNEMEKIAAMTFYFDYSTTLVQRLRAG